MSGKVEKHVVLACSFCGKKQQEVRKLIAGPTVYICDECIRQCTEMLREEARLNEEPVPDLPTPVQIKEFLDGYVVGQDMAKRVLSVAVYNHYKRIWHKRLARAEGKEVRPGETVELQKSNVLLIGPTGSGKTLLARSLAKFLNVPFAIADATSLTEAGYVGEDVENIVQTLLQNADFDVEKCGRGIIYIDEIDKVSRKGESSSVRDVGGEGVQQALLKIVEGTKANVSPRGGRKFSQQEFVQVDTSDILFICGGSFHGIETGIRRREGVKGLGFGAEIERRDERSVGELLRHVEPQDVIKFGMIPEFVGRLPVITTLSDLTEDDLVRILTEPKNALVKQYQKMFALENVKLSFTRDALRAIARAAMRRNGGARGLRAVMESVMLDIMYDVPYREGIRECKITEGVILRHEKPSLTFSKEKKSA